MALRDLVELEASNVSIEISQVLSRFLVVRTCGYLEQATEQACLQYLNSKSSHPFCQAFNQAWFGHGRSPTPKGLIELATRLDPESGAALEIFLKEDDAVLLREIKFLVDRRNKIAHGLNEGITARKALDLVPHAERVADWFFVRFDPR